MARYMRDAPAQTWGPMMTDLATLATEEALTRIARLDPGLRAFATVDADDARRQARLLDARAAAGAPAGMLYGTVVAVKDIIDLAGLPTGGGSLTRADALPASRDAVIVARLREAGAVLIGKTNTVEFAFGGWGTNVTVGTPRNPWDMTEARAPGGSSSGSGVAVGAGIVPLALGTDTGGSVRLPAAFCGIVGLKTTAGLLPLDGVLPLSSRFDTIGPMARTVADTARLLAAMLAEDAARLPEAGRLADPAALAAGGVAGRRIGVLDAPDVALDDDVARCFAETQRMLAALGAELVPARLPRPVTDYVSAMNLLIGPSGYAIYAALAEAEPNLLGPPVRGRMLAGRDVPPAQTRAEQAHQRDDIARVADLFAGIDALLTPTTAFPAPTLAACDEAVSPSIFTRFVNYLDLAAISLPMGLSREGLPIGMQLVVPGLQEVRALAFAAALERARGAFPSPAL
jgi:aspartyl-tRNA(Asn)/glutamyl-tRNA(Gln) amidotransferase subunit A